jgi:hypothetical protein
MVRNLLILFGLVEMIAPKPIIDACERIGLESPETARLRPRANLLARLEGAAVVWLLVRGRERSPLASTLLSGTGILAIVYPDPLIRFSQSFAYENASELELRPWVRPAARLLGALYLLVVLLSGSGTAPDRTDE